MPRVPNFMDQFPDPSTGAKSKKKRLRPLDVAKSSGLIDVRPVSPPPLDLFNSPRRLDWSRR